MDVLEGRTWVNIMKYRNEWLEWGKAILIAILLAVFIRTFVFSTSIVDGDSMEPTLQSGERIIFNKFIYFVGQPKRGDVVIIQRTHKNYVKRIIALPEETIEIRNHVLYINDEEYDQLYLPDDPAYLTGDFGPITVPENSYYVMGDNRAVSKDSRNGLGFISGDDIIGRSEFVIYPIKEMQIIK